MKPVVVRPVISASEEDREFKVTLCCTEAVLGYRRPCLEREGRRGGREGNRSFEVRENKRPFYGGPHKGPGFILVERKLLLSHSFPGHQMNMENVIATQCAVRKQKAAVREDGRSWAARPNSLCAHRFSYS